MGKNGMVQWAPGTRLQRIDRNDGTYEVEMAAVKKRVDALKKSLDGQKTVKPKFKKGELVLANGEVETCGDIDPNGSWVIIWGVKVGAEMLKKLPAWYVDAHIKMLLEVDGVK